MLHGQKEVLEWNSMLGCDFLKKIHRYADTHKNLQEPLFSDVDHCFRMVSNDYFLFLCDFVGAQILRYAICR